jgi:hypothetical protein
MRDLAQADHQLDTFADGVGHLTERHARLVSKALSEGSSNRDLGLITRRSRVQIPLPPPRRFQLGAGAAAPALIVTGATSNASSNVSLEVLEVLEVLEALSGGAGVGVPSVRGFHPDLRRQADNARGAVCAGNQDPGCHSGRHGRQRPGA